MTCFMIFKKSTAMTLVTGPAGRIGAIAPTLWAGLRAGFWAACRERSPEQECTGRHNQQDLVADSTWRVREMGQGHCQGCDLPGGHMKVPPWRVGPDLRVGPRVFFKTFSFLIPMKLQRQL